MRAMWFNKAGGFGAMDAAQLNEYAQRLERKLKHSWRRANLGRYVTQALDIQTHVQQQLEERADRVGRSDLESARNTASEIIRRGLNTMRPAQVKEYVEGLERGVQTDHVQFATKVSDIQMCVQDRLENIQDKIDDKSYLENARDKASEIIQQKLEIMEPAQLNEYAQRLGYKLADRQQQGANIGQLVMGALDIEMRAQKRLESELHEADKEDLNSAMVNARDIIRQELDAMSPNSSQRTFMDKSERSQCLIRYTCMCTSG